MYCTCVKSLKKFHKVVNIGLLYVWIVHMAHVTYNFFLRATKKLATKAHQ